jgi:hypothetical protein
MLLVVLGSLKLEVGNIKPCASVLPLISLVEVLLLFWQDFQAGEAILRNVLVGLFFIRFEAFLS